MVIGVFLLPLAVLTVLSAKSDPRIGTWKLNAGKSKFDSPATVRAGETRTYTASGDSVTMNTERVNTDGSKQVYGVTYKPDGKDYPYTVQLPGGADTVSVRRKGNGFTTESKKGGKVLYTSTTIFSADGKLMTLTTKGVDDKGQSINSVRVYDKQ